LKKIEEQIKKTKMYAPSDGLVIYATSAGGGRHRHGRSEPLAEGQDVRERQALIHLPTTTSVKAEISIHESSLEKVKINMPASVTIDALPGQAFTGYVATIAPLPDPQSMWMNPDLKVYNSDIYLDSNDAGLRTGMSCKAEIIIEQHKDAVYVPVQAVIRVKGEPTVYVTKGNSYKPRKVKIGLDNNRMVHIISGLKRGEKVLLAPPLASGEVESNAAKKIDQEPPGDKRAFKAAPAGQKPLKGEGKSGQVKKKLRERYENMSPEEKEKMRQQWQTGAK
jgi:HlyD family secretion protein